ncbi:hypothetical protein [Actinomyces oris]|jgi:hypothetical protein|uniref:YobI family P-loop NTPase n=1 Tax=Actinomyces oris TaxID=544580 RepID=UPI0024309F40|nr:hypothetical protein [Actinomyces oris]
MISNSSASTEKDEAAEGKNVRELKSFRPCHDLEQHRIYVDALNNAIQQDEVKNIALSGPYGVGKSSILQGFRKDPDGKYRDDIITISLSTLGFSKSADSDSRYSADASISPQTNQIQKEIVKQLLYRKPPNELPASRFKRIQKPDRKQSQIVSALIGFILTIVIAAIGGFSKIPKVCDSAWWEFGVKFVCLWLLLSLVAWLASQYLQGAVHLDKFTAGPATLTLSGSDNSDGDSYFDRYLDEIIYFFEMSTCRIVIFEDIDRFSNWEIFEELRELNTLLNNAEQIRDENSESSERKIVFIYAMRDSIFEPQVGVDAEEVAKDSQDEATQEVQRANRTKFFDIIIPVVPFVTHRSARDLMRQELEGIEPEVSGKLIGRVAKYIPDFRLLRSVCNEYVIYSRLVLKGNSLKLESDKLFALMLYKSVHLKDFERIHLGQSKLDEVYRISLRVRDDCIRRINDQYDALEKRLESNVEAGDIQERASKLRKMVEWVAARSAENVESFSVEIDSYEYPENEINELPFWAALSKVSNNQPVVVRYRHGIYSSQVTVLHFNKTEMEEFVGKSIFTAPIYSEIHNDIESSLTKLERKRERYRLATMAKLMSDSSATVTSARTAEPSPFAKYVKTLLGSELAAALIRYGYIDRNFVLYASTYHDTFLSANAMTFRLQHMERDLMNPNYELSDGDVQQLMSDTTIDLKEFARPGAYNVAILNYLLLNKDKYRGHFEAVIGSMLKDSNNADILLQAFFTSDTPSYNQISLIDELTPRCSRTFDVLVSLRGVPDDQQVGYVDVALRSVSSDTDYDTSLLKEFVEQHYKAMATFTDPIADKTVDTLETLMSQAGVKFSDISQIDSKLREHLIENGCYEVNRHNLEFVSGDNQEALDVLSWNRPSVYAYLLQSLEAYFAILAEDKSGKLSALVGSADTAKVVADVVKLDVAGNNRVEDSVADDANLGDSESFPLLSNLLASSGGDWSIDLDGLPSSCWPMLATHDRLAVTTSNLWQYVRERDVDDALIELLERHSSIKNQGDTLSNDEYIELATAILNLKEEQISAKQRVTLVASIDHVDPIPASHIKVKEGKLVGHLIKAGLIDDNSDAYRLVLNLEWSSREFAIASSQRFADYMDTSLVGNDVLAIVKSQLVPAKVKQNIIDNISSYCYGMSVEDLTSLAKYAASQQDLTASGDALIWLLNQGVKPNVVVPLLVAGLDILSGSDVRNIVMALGQPYSDLLEKGVSRVHVDEIMGFDRLLERLKDVGEVTTYTKDGRKRRYAVYRHRGPKP